MSLLQFTQHKNFKKIVIASFFAASILSWLIMQTYGHYYVSTDNAYVNANIVQIAPRVTGKVDQLIITNNQYVKAGEELFALDAEPFQIAVNSAKAELNLTLADLDKTSHTEKRVLDLVNKKFLSAQEGDNTVAAYKVALAKVEQAQAQLAQASLNLQYTKVLAPTSGWITNLTLRSGNIVSANQPLFALISDEEFWIDANFKETEMKAIKPGQLAEIKADMYPGHTFHGVVESISGGAGSAFSLLPPQNATGNWVKVTQRVPIRIRVLDTDANFPLRIGTSATVKISLHHFQVKQS